MAYGAAEQGCALFYQQLLEGGVERRTHGVGGRRGGANHTVLICEYVPGVFKVEVIGLGVRLHVEPQRVGQESVVPALGLHALDATRWVPAQQPDAVCKGRVVEEQLRHVQSVAHQPVVHGGALQAGGGQGGEGRGHQVYARKRARNRGARILHRVTVGVGDLGYVVAAVRVFGYPARTGGVVAI